MLISLSIFHDEFIPNWYKKNDYFWKMIIVQSILAIVGIHWILTATYVVPVITPYVDSKHNKKQKQQTLQIKNKIPSIFI